MHQYLQYSVRIILLDYKTKDMLAYLILYMYLQLCNYHYMYISIFTIFIYVLQPSAYRMLVIIKRRTKGSVLGTVVCLPGEYYRYIIGYGV